MVPININIKYMFICFCVKKHVLYLTNQTEWSKGIFTSDYLFPFVGRK